MKSRELMLKKMTELDACNTQPDTNNVIPIQTDSSPLFTTRAGN